MSGALLSFRPERRWPNTGAVLSLTYLRPTAACQSAEARWSARDRIPQTHRLQVVFTTDHGKLKTGQKLKISRLVSSVMFCGFPETLSSTCPHADGAKLSLLCRPSGFQLHGPLCTEQA
eukprot:EG_transcript_54683